MQSGFKKIFLYFMILLTVSTIYGSKKSLKINNDKIQININFVNGTLQTETVKLKQDNSEFDMQTDGDFLFDIVYTSWRAPGKINNSANPVYFTKQDFEYVGEKKYKDNNGTENLDII